MPEPTRLPEQCPQCGFEELCFTVTADKRRYSEVHCGSVHDPDAAHVCGWSMPVAEDERGVVRIVMPAEEIVWMSDS